MSKIRDFFVNLKKSTKITLISCVSFVLMTFIILCFFIISPITPDDKAGNTFGRESVSANGSTVSGVTTSDGVEVSKGTTNTTANGITTTHTDYTITVTSGTGMYYDGRIVIGGEEGYNNYNNDNSGYDNNSGNNMDVPEDQYAGNGSGEGYNNGGDNSGSGNGDSGSSGGDQNVQTPQETPASNETGNSDPVVPPSDTPQQQTEAPQQNIPPQINPEDLPPAQVTPAEPAETPQDQPADGGGAAAGGDNSGSGENAE